MTSIFLFSLIVGGGLLVLSLAGDLFGVGDAEFDADFDADFDFDADLGMELDGGVEADGAGSMAAGGTAVDGDLASAFRIFTIRNLTYFLFGFGGIGWVLDRLRPDLPTPIVTLAAVTGGLVAAALAALIFGWVQATESGDQAGEDSYVGCEGRVVLPVRHGNVGTIVVRRGDREHELRALPFDRSAASPQEWRSVMVIEMDGGTARVSPLKALAPADGGRAENGEG